MKFFLPIEIKDREFDSRILIAKLLLNRGFEVIVGRKNEINKIALHSKNCFYLSKSCAKIDYPFFKLLKNRNIKIMVIDEEAIIHQNETAHIKSRLSYDSLLLIEAYFAWGEYDKNVLLKNFPKVGEKSFTFGNPRIDILRKEFRPFFKNKVDDISNRFGDFILIPSSFAMCNHFTEKGPRLKWRESLGMISSENDKKFYIGYFEHFNSIFNTFLRDIKKLALNFPKINFVVRPHPSDNRETFFQAFKGLPNIHVISEGSVIPWLIASKFVIHNGCTTAIESFLLDKHIISYRPYVDEAYDLDVPNKISLQIFNYKDLLREVSKSLNSLDLKYRENGIPIIQKYLCNFKKDSNLAAFQIVNYACSFNITKKRRFSIKPWLYSKYSQIYDSCYDLIFNILKFIKNIFFIKNKKLDYTAQKFPNLNFEEVEQRLYDLNFFFKEKTLLKFSTKKNIKNVVFIKSKSFLK